MSRITHFKQQPKSVYYWDYYILCRLNVAAAIALQRLEYWDGTKDAAITHAEAYNDAQEENSQAGTQDTSRWVYKAQDELQWELMGITGEKGTAALLKFLQDDTSYLASRNNPDLPFDRKRQYEFQAKRVQEHLNYLTYIISYFQSVKTRLSLVYFAIELLTQEHIYIEELSVAHVLKKLVEMHDDPKLPKFLKNEFTRDKTLPNKAIGAVIPFRNIAEWRVAILRNGQPQYCGINGGESAETTPQNRGSNSSNYNQSLQSVITNNKEREASGNNTSQEAANATGSLALPSDLTLDEIALITRIIEERRHTPSQEEPEGIEQTTPTQEPPPTVEETSRKASNRREKSGKTSKSVTKQRVSVLSTPEPSSGALAILTAWRNVVWGSSSNKETPRTKENLEAAEELARIGATEDDLRKVRDRLNGQTDGWWKRRGVKLKNIANHFDLAAPSGERGKTDYNEVAGMTDEQRETYRRQQQEKQKQALPPGVDREALMKLPPEERIAVLKKLREQQPVSA